MDSATMVKGDLTPEMIQAGADFIRALDAAHVPVTAAFWLCYGDEPTWRLMIASPEVAQMGMRSFYGKLYDNLASLRNQELDLSKVSVAAPDDRIVSAVRKFVSVPGIAGLRLTGNVFNGLLVPDAHIYRMT